MLRIVEKALTFDDVLLIPNFSEVLPKDVDLKTKLTKKIKLNIPLLSSAMDTVTEARFAIAIAQEGGVGIIHKNLSIEKQAKQVLAVKKYEAGIISHPITIDVNASLSELLHLTKKYKISSIPVLENGYLEGIITSRDTRFTTDLSKPIKELMTSKEKLITVREGINKEEAKSILHKHRLERLLVVDDKNNLKGMMTVNDIEKDRAYPLASKDNKGSLLVGAAIGTGLDSFERADALIKAGVDILVVDTAHGHSKGVLDIISQMRSKYPHIQIIGGNIATADAALALVKSGVDAVKVGIGPGSICTTRIIAGVGVPQISAIFNVSQALKGTGIPIIADGGIRYSGDIAKAIAAGASTVMLGSIFAGTEETPGDIEIYHGRSYKTYRGMGSLSAMSQGSADRYFQDKNTENNKLVPEGVEGRVPYKGSVVSVIHQMLGGLKASMGYTGCKTIIEMQTKTEFVQITGSGIKESHVHDVHITKEAPNYYTQ